MLRSWNINIQFRPFKPGVALYLQVAEQIIEDIKSGRLQPLTVMPSTRELAEFLNLNRKTIVLSYDELIAQGWLTTQSRRGTFVSENLPHKPSQDQGNIAGHLQPPQASREETLKGRALLDTSIDVSEGRPDRREIPYELFARAIRRSLAQFTRSNSHSVLDYKGMPTLRKSIASMLNLEHGFQIGPDNLCLTRGIQQGIYITAKAMHLQGQYVVLEQFSDPWVRKVFESLGSKVLFAGLDAHGLNVNQLERYCEQFPVKVLCITPQHQYPTTMTYSPERRVSLLAMARRYGFTIVEVDRTHQVHYDYESQFPMTCDASLAPTIYISTLANVLPSDLQVGFIAASPGVVDACAAELELIDQPGDNITQLATDFMIQQGDYQRILRRLSKSTMSAGCSLPKLSTTILMACSNTDCLNPAWRSGCS